MFKLDKNFCPMPIPVEVKTDPFSLDGLIAWLAQQPPDRKYEWYYCEACLMHAYFSEGLALPNVPGHPTLFLRGGNIFSYSDLFSSVHAYHAVGKPTPWTFGAALSRARMLSHPSLSDRGEG